MGYIESEGTLLGANMKKGGKMVLQIEVTQDLDSREDYYHLRKMIEKNIRFSLESQVVQYNVALDARTEKPIKNYRVDEKGVVSEVKPEGEQVEMELEGVPKEEVPVKHEAKESDKTIIDDFIVSGLAPTYEDLPYDFAAYVQRIRSGETYMKIANELDVSSGRVAEIIEDYRTRVAPLAIKWDEWRKGNVQSEPAANKEGDVEEVTNPDPKETGEAGAGTTDTDSVEFEPEQEETAGEEVEQSQNEQEGQGEEGTASKSVSSDISKEELEKYILEKRPAYDDLPIDFPALLEKRLQQDKTWLEIAKETGMTSGQLSSRWSAYKKRVAEQMKDGGAA
ncbi:aldo/keto reductase [Paenibacillus sp. MER 180]|uniref:aldo/keto reductase n=1 Tax=Paenibacillus sp. MER 180 TaxID=2939570 RepID=UPI00203CC10C|nr:aldo/keto reductase [Paenibacillus sp. MER 180]MCM3292379.1 aldo/keto reductase [Paenibacillus sp. MER 180]